LVLTEGDVSGAGTTDNIYAKMDTIHATAGGFEIMGWSDTDAGALFLSGEMGATSPTATTPAIVIAGSKWDGSGTGGQVLAAAETVLQIKNYTSTLMTILGSGNVGIGTATPDPSSAGWGNALTVAHTSTEPAIELWLNNASVGDEARIGQINFMSGTTAKINAAIGAKQNGTAEAEAHLIFNTRDSGDTGGTPDERMRITSDGNVGIGTAAPAATLSVVTDDAANYVGIFQSTGNHTDALGLYIRTGENSPTTTAGINKYLVFSDGDGTASGGVQNGTTQINPEFFNGSDERIKTNIVDTPIKGLEIINGFEMKQFEFKLDKFKGQTHRIGFIAQNCETVYPEMVSEQKYMSESWEMDEPVKCVSQGTLIPVLVKAIQELSAKVTALENA